MLRIMAVLALVLGMTGCQENTITEADTSPVLLHEADCTNDSGQSDRSGGSNPEMLIAKAGCEE